MKKNEDRILKNKEVYASLLTEKSMFNALLNSDEALKKNVDWFNKNVNNNFNFYDQNNELFLSDLNISLNKNSTSFENITLLNNWLLEIEKLLPNQIDINENVDHFTNNFKTNDLEALLDDYRFDDTNSPYYEGLETVSIDKTGEITINKFEF